MFIKSLLLWLRKPPTPPPNAGATIGSPLESSLRFHKKWQTFQSAGGNMQSESRANGNVAAGSRRQAAGGSWNVDKTPPKERSIKRLRQRTRLGQRSGRCWDFCDCRSRLCFRYFLYYDCCRFSIDIAFENTHNSHNSVANQIAWCANISLRQQL